MQTKFKDGAKAKLPDYKLTGQRDISDALAFTRPPTGTIGETPSMRTCAQSDSCLQMHFYSIWLWRGEWLEGDPAAANRVVAYS